MSFFQILFWQDIPTQVKAWDDFDEIKVELSNKFIVKVDLEAKAQGLTAQDDYLAQWRWSDEQEREGTPEEVAESVKNEIETELG